MPIRSFLSMLIDTSAILISSRVLVNPGFISCARAGKCIVCAWPYAAWQDADEDASVRGADRLLGHGMCYCLHAADTFACQDEFGAMATLAVVAPAPVVWPCPAFVHAAPELYCVSCAQCKPPWRRAAAVHVQAVHPHECKTFSARRPLAPPSLWLGTARPGRGGRFCSAAPQISPAWLSPMR
jgi:hypothetical protein